MIQELLYTSAPRGLKPGSRGFCTVLSTSGMPAPVATALESLSGYRPVFPPGDPQAALNPVVHSHLQMSLNGRRSSVLSRISDYGLDYSQRTNKLAHHLVIEAGERSPAGPAWVLGHSGMTRHNWDGELKLVSGERPVPQQDSSLRVCSAWKDLTGDAGWAGVLAEAFLKHPDQPAFLIFSPGMDLLPLIEEAVALLPANRRWDVTFSTYFTKIPNGVTCNWRCLLADSPEAKESRRHVQSLRIDLTQPLQRARGGHLVEAARTGCMVISSGPEFTAQPHNSAPPVLPSAPTATPPIRVSPDHSLPPLIPSQDSVPPVRRRKSKSHGTILWIVVLVLIAATAAGAGFYLSELKQHQQQGQMVALNEPAAKPTAPKAPNGTESQVEGKKPTEKETASAAEKPDVIVKPDAKPGAGENTGTPQTPASPVVVADQQSQPPGKDSQKPTAAGKSETPAPQLPVDNEAAMAAGNVQSPSDSSGDAPADEEANSKFPRLSFYYWDELENGLETDKSKKFELNGIQDGKVAIWCPSETSSIVHSIGSRVEQDFQRNKEWKPYLEVKLNQNKEVEFLPKAAIPHVHICRFVTVVSEKNTKQETIILPYRRVTSRSTSNDKFRSATLTYPIETPKSDKTWNLQLQSIQFAVHGESRTQISHNGTIDLPSKAGDKKTELMLSLLNPGDEVAPTDKEADENDLNRKVPVEITISASKIASDTRPHTGIEAKIAVNKFLILLQDEVKSDIDDAISSTSNLSSLKANLLKDGDLILSEAFLKDIERVKDDLDKIIESNKEIAGEKEPDKTAKDKKRKAANEQLARINRLKNHSELMKSMSEQLFALELQELQISQKCQNGDENRFLPIFVYIAPDPASTPAKK